MTEATQAAGMREQKLETENDFKFVNRQNVFWVGVLLSNFTDDVGRI